MFVFSSIWEDGIEWLEGWENNNVYSLLELHVSENEYVVFGFFFFFAIDFKKSYILIVGRSNELLALLIEQKRAKTLNRAHGGFISFQHMLVNLESTSWRNTYISEVLYIYKIYNTYILYTHMHSWLMDHNC